MSKAERMLSYSLLSLITGKALASAPMTGLSEDDALSSPKGKGIVNSAGAWCWREGCAGTAGYSKCSSGLALSGYKDCLKLSKAMQKTSEMLQKTADLYDDHVSSEFTHCPLAASVDG
jgi:sorting nexin-9/18/33